MTSKSMGPEQWLEFNDITLEDIYRSVFNGEIQNEEWAQMQITQAQKQNIDIEGGVDGLLAAWEEMEYEAQNNGEFERVINDLDL